MSPIELAQSILDDLYVLDWAGPNPLLDTIVEAIEVYGDHCRDEGFDEGIAAERESQEMMSI